VNFVALASLVRPAGGVFGGFGKQPIFGRKQEFLELAPVCDEVANEIDDRRASG
jgi:hypothetical protein